MNQLYYRNHILYNITHCVYIYIYIYTYSTHTLTYSRVQNPS